MPKIPVLDVLIGKEELQNVAEAVETGWISWRGHFVGDFEREFAKYIGTAHGVSCFNGTVALHLAVEALGIGKDDEVILPAFTYIASANAVAYAGAKPVFVDSTSEYWEMDPSKIEEKINKKTKAIMPVHLYGHPCDMDPIMEIAEKHDLKVIEDCAEAHGAEYKGRKVGTFGDINCYSFFANKIITTGEGGMCLTNDAELDQKMRALRNHGVMQHTSDPYWHEIKGYNYRMTNLQAALGVAQLKKIEMLIEKRRKLARTYNKYFAKAKGVVTAPEMKWAKNVYWAYSILVKDRKTRDAVRLALERQEIETRPFFHPVNAMPVYKTSEHFAVAEDLSARGINLPSGPPISEEQIKIVAEAVLKAL